MSFYSIFSQLFFNLKFLLLKKIFGEGTLSGECLSYWQGTEQRFVV